MWQDLVLFIIGLSGGILVAGGLFAFLTVVGVITRLMAGTKTAKNALLYEDMSVLGLICGNLVYFYGTTLPIGFPGLLIYGVGSGIFTGCLAAALAEVVNVIPVLQQRVKLQMGMSFVILCFAFGKLAGALFQLFMM